MSALIFAPKLTFRTPGVTGVSCYATFLPLPLSPSCFPVRASPGEQKKGEEKPCKPNTSHLHVPFFKRLFLNISEDGFLSIS